MKNTDKTLQFPPGFLWGAGTSAYQFEGDSFNTQWHEFEKAGGIKTGEHCGKACDWWNNAEKDFDIARNMGLNSLRLSVSWARIEPSEGIFDAEAVERYHRMLSALIERNIQPIVCLHHFAHPAWFEKKGAFLSETCSDDFVRFVKFIVSELLDVCSIWLTFNEPNVYALEGYLEGNHPPAIRCDLIKYFRVLENMARCHAAAYHEIHTLQKDALVSFANRFIIFKHAKDQTFDRLAKRMAGNTFNNVFFNMLQREKLMKDTFDFIGVNIYGGVNVAFDVLKPHMAFVRRIKPDSRRAGDLDADGNSMFGEIYPEGIKIVVEKFTRFGKPFFILESGVPDRNDTLRPWLIATAVRMIHSLIAQDFKIIGYHHWSLMDSFEWEHGYSMKFGLVETDPSTQIRTPRKSALFYGEIARANALDEEMIRRYLPESIDEIYERRDLNLSEDEFRCI